MLGEEDANALMTEFPSLEADELVTKQFLRAEIAEMRTAFSGLQGEFGGLRGEFADLRGEFTDLRGEFADLRAEFGGLRGEFVDLRIAVGDLRTEVAERMHQQTVRLAGALGGAITVSTAVLGTLVAVS